MLQWLDISQPPIRVVNPARCNKPAVVAGGQILGEIHGPEDDLDVWAT